MAAARFLLDRSVGGRLLVTRLRDAGWDARTLAEEYGDARAQAMRDEEWIADGTRSGYVLLAKDHRVASRPLEAQAIYMHEARVVAFARGELAASSRLRRWETCVSSTSTPSTVWRRLRRPS
jgi:hypothetical protein